MINLYFGLVILNFLIFINLKKIANFVNIFDNPDGKLKLHKIKRLIVINHRDCGAAKIIYGKKKFDNFNETKIHENSFTKIKNRFKN